MRVRASIDTADRVIGTGSSSSTGRYKFGIRIPRKTAIGPHTIIVRTQGRQYETVIAVVPEDETQGASFGSTAGPLLAAWAALLALVAAFFVGSRRRKRTFAVASVGDDEVPTIDTSSFVPTQPQLREKSKPNAPSSKPKTARKSAGSKPARPKGANGKAKPSTQPEPVKPKAVAKTTRNRAAITERGGPKAPQSSAGNAKPKQPRNDTANTPEL